MSGYFNDLPDNIRLPFTYTEFDPSMADRGLSDMAFHVLLVGQKLATGTAEPLIPMRPTTGAQADVMFGAGSMLAEMVKAFLGANKLTKMSAIGVNDFDGGTKATGSLTFAGAVTGATPICLYLGGKLTRLGTVNGDDAEDVAASLAAAINAKVDLPVTATAAEGVVTLTAKHSGALGNDIDIRFGYSGEDFPAGLGVTVAPMAGGAGNPDALETVAALGGERYHVIAWPWGDTASLNALKEELDSRFGPLRQIDGQAFLVKKGSFSEVTTFTAGRNDKHLTVFASEGSPTLPWVDCAASSGVIAYYADDDPARPFQTLPIPGVLAPRVEDRWADFPEKNQALYEGCSVRSVNASGQVVFSNVITTYRFSEAGAETVAYLQLNSLFTLSFLRYDWNNYLRLKYPRHKLASDDQGKRMNAGEPVMTPTLGKAEAINRMYEWMARGLIEAPDDFKDHLVVERDSSNQNRLNWIMMPDLVNQFRIAATSIKFLI
ncbi:MAG: phage tail sheath subtilisin-like domain-containing protein [Deltaproteobacteria bacterium]|jgi:phage tail sheath gpL-like|nr:phage tail sheath subtilisin-like domain-containing protein [Deltaproteobacteria bacterium]